LVICPEIRQISVIGLVLLVLVWAGLHSVWLGTGLWDCLALSVGRGSAEWRACWRVARCCTSSSLLRVAGFRLSSGLWKRSVVCRSGPGLSCSGSVSEESVARVCCYAAGLAFLTGKSKVAFLFLCDLWIVLNKQPLTLQVVCLVSLFKFLLVLIQIL